MPTILGKYFHQRLPLVKVQISNQVPEYGFDEAVSGAAATKTSEVRALVDTGATNSIFDESIAKRLMLISQSQKNVLFPGMDSARLLPAYTCALFFHETFDTSARRHEWPDLADMIALNLEGRDFQVVLGMDILSKGTLAIERGSAISFEFDSAPLMAG